MSEQPPTASQPASAPLPSTESARTESPGAYVILGKGLLVRVPPEGAVSQGGPGTVVSTERALTMSWIASDPWIPVSRARCAAANRDLPVNF